MTSTAARPFVWYDLMTTDPQAALAFYGSVVGWTSEVMDSGGGPYHLLMAGGVPAGGLMAMPPEAGGAGPVWMGYVGVEDVDAAAESIRQAGGTVHHAPADIPGVGRFAVVADPQGAAFQLFKGIPSEDSAMPAPMSPGSIGWHELHSSDPEAGLRFYESQFGWRRDEALDMGPMGTYQLFATTGDACGGMMRLTEGMPASTWLYYFAVDDIDRAKAALEKAGGKTLNGPMEVPGGAWIVQALDPQGAMFALVGMRAAAGDV